MISIFQCKTVNMLILMMTYFSDMSTCNKQIESLSNWILRKNSLTSSFSSVKKIHHSDIIMGRTASQFTSVSIVYSIVCSEADQRKHQSSVSLAFVRGIHWWPVNSPHKGPVMQKIFPFDDIIMLYNHPTLHTCIPNTTNMKWYTHPIPIWFTGNVMTYLKEKRRKLFQLLVPETWRSILKYLISKHPILSDI